ncbi:hypothetical protein L0152_32170, partial [bacterium]|nr:hypothetical protein [bacterium]
MSSIKPKGLGGPTSVAGNSSTTSAAKSADTNSMGESSPTPRAQEKKSLQQLATAKKAELALSTISIFLNRGFEKDGRGDVGMIRVGNYS